MRLLNWISARRNFFLGLLLLLGGHLQSFGQSCSCPPIATCGCQVGLTKLTVQFNGLLSVTVTVRDGDNNVLYSNLALLPGSTFEVESFGGSGQPFAGDVVTITTNLFGTSTINTSCTNQVKIGTSFGNFTVIDGESVGGVPICCEVMETTPPVINGCPSDISLAADIASCGANVSWTAPTVSDNCTVSSFTSSHNPGDFFSAGTTTTVTYRAEDDYGNFTTCSFTVTVNDNTAPVISGCPLDITVSANASCQAIVNWTAPTVSDNCTGTLTSDHSPGETFGLGTTLVTYTATDGAGNTSTCSFTVTVVDNTAPIINGCPSDISLSANASCQAVVNWTAPTASDNCTATLMSDHSPGETFGLGTTPVTYTATDGAGNTSTCSFNVTVVDNTAPVINGCPSDISLSANASCQAVINWTAPTTSDNCTVTLTSNHNPGETFGLGTTPVTYTATDGSGNTSTCSFTVTVVDSTVPVINGCPSDISVSANGSCQAVVNWTAPTASDNCTVTLTSDYNPGETFGLGTTPVAYTATDGSGNTSTCSFTVTVVDSTVPVINGCPSDISVSSNGSCQAVVNWTAPTASDNCTATLTSDHSPGETFGLGTTPVTYTATDGAGNTSTCSFTVTVVDNTAPIINGCPSNISVAANASCQAVINWTAPTTSDNCTVTLMSDHSPGETFGLGTTPVTYTATDGSGNTSTCTFNVTVVDNTAPVISGCPSNISVFANASCQAVVNWTVPTASDNCTVTLTSSHNPGETFSLGTTPVTYTATDGAGNISTCSFNVTVVDSTVPVISGCPSNITVSANASCQAVVNWTAPTASDNCTMTLTSNHSPGETFGLGTTPVTYTATDGSGNTSTCSFNVTVVDDNAPIINGCPSNISVAANASCQAVINWTAPTASDNCTATLTSNHNPGETFGLGTTPVTYTATDGSGNTSTCSFNVTVVDNTAPAINGCPQDIIASAVPSSCGVSVTWTVPTAVDCTSGTTVTSDYNPGDFFPIGSTTVTYTADDGNGNITTCSFDVIVNDDIPPVFQSCPSEISVVADNTCQATASWTEPTATDNCGVASVTSSHTPGSTFPTGTTEVEYVATDIHGNVSFCRFNVVVRKNDVPVVSGCSQDINVEAGESGEINVTWDPPTASNQCGDVALVSTHEPGSLFSVGTTTVEYKAADDNSNTVVCSFNVVVSYEALEFDIAKIVTPDGDGINDGWILANIEKFNNNNVVIVDRWGSVIYRASGYDNNGVVWRGTTSGGTLVPTGTYFYIIEVDFRDRRVKKSGFIEVVR